MKNHLLASLFFLIVGAFYISSCGKTYDYLTDTEITKSGGFKVGSRTFDVPNPTMTFTTVGDVTNNTVHLVASNGSKIEVGFPGTSLGSFPLTSANEVYYYDSTGKKYQAVNGLLTISYYLLDGDTHYAAGAFYFRARALTAPIDSFQITGGKFVNASN